MKKVNNYLKKFALTVLVAFVLNGCNDNEIPFEVSTDVYVIHKKAGDEIISAAAYYVYGNQEILSATVTLPNSVDKIELEEYPFSLYTHAKEPVENDFSSIAPEEGKYVFTVKSVNGELLQLEDLLSYNGLAIPQITKTSFSGVPYVLKVEWNSVPEADGYVVKMLDDERNLIFTGYSVGKDIKEYYVSGSSATGYWNKPATDGEPFIVVLNAFTYDSEATSSNFSYNISEVSVGEKMIIWGVN